MLLELKSSYRNLQHAFSLQDKIESNCQYIKSTDLLQHALKHNGFFGITSILENNNMNLIQSFLKDEGISDSILIYDSHNAFSKFATMAVVVQEASKILPFLDSSKLVILNNAHTIKPYFLRVIFEEAKKHDVLVIYSIPIYAMLFQISILHDTNYFIYTDTKTSGYAFTDKHLKTWLQELDKPALSQDNIIQTNNLIYKAANEKN